MEIYIDVFLFENIIINLFLLLLTFRLLRLNYRKINIYLAALLGGIYALVIFSNDYFILLFLIYLALHKKFIK